MIRKVNLVDLKQKKGRPFNNLNPPPEENPRSALPDSDL